MAAAINSDNIYSMRMLLEAFAAFDERPSGGEEQNRNQYEENVQHFFTLCDVHQRDFVAVIGQSARQFLFLCPPETPGGGHQHRRAGFQGVPEALHAVARQNHLRLHGKRTTAGEIHELFHQVGVYQGGANERYGVGQGMDRKQKDAGIEPRSQDRGAFQGSGSSFGTGIGHHQFQLAAGFACGQTAGVDAKLTANLHFSTLKARA